jgi:hypothetical protein
MDLREGAGDGDGEAQEASHLHGCAEQSVQWLAAGILEQQHDPTAVVEELERAYRPSPVQLVLQFVFARQAIEGGRCRMLRSWQHGEHGGAITIGVALASAEDAFAVLPQDLEAANSTNAQPRGWIHVRNSAVRSVAAKGDHRKLEHKAYHRRCGMTMSVPAVFEGGGLSPISPWRAMKKVGIL